MLNTATLYILYWLVYLTLNTYKNLNNSDSTPTYDFFSSPPTQRCFQISFAKNLMLFQLKLVTTSNGNEAACIVTHVDKVIF